MLRTIAPRFFQSAVRRFSTATTPKTISRLGEWYVAGATDLGGTILGDLCNEPEKSLVKMVKKFAVTNIRPREMREVLISQISSDYIEGTNITYAEVRRGMGLFKELHIKEIRDLLEKKGYINLPSVKTMRSYFEEDLNALLRQGVKAIPHANEALIAMNAEIPMFGTSGFSSVSSQIAIEQTKHQLPPLKFVVSADQVLDHSRPSMVIEGLRRLGKWPSLDKMHRLQTTMQDHIIDYISSRSFLITDSVNDVETTKARLPKLPIVCVTDYGTCLGIRDRSDVAKMSVEEFAEKRKIAREKLFKAGADGVVNDFRGVIPMLLELANRLQAKPAPRLKI